MSPASAAGLVDPDSPDNPSSEICGFPRDVGAGKEEGDGDTSSTLSGLYSVAITCLSGTNIGKSSNHRT